MLLEHACQLRRWRVRVMPRRRRPPDGRIRHLDLVPRGLADAVRAPRGAVVKLPCAAYCFRVASPEEARRAREEVRRCPCRLVKVKKVKAKDSRTVFHVTHWTISFVFVWVLVHTNNCYLSR